MPRTIKCYNCGGLVAVNERTHMGLCPLCAAQMYVPDENALNEESNAANLLLSERRFDEAREAYEALIDKQPEEASYWWGRALSEYGIQFVESPQSHEIHPTLHRLSETRFSENFYVKKAIEYSPDLDIRQFYLEQSREIDDIQVGSLQISTRETPCDIFICYKRSGMDQAQTEDSAIARKLYNDLKRVGYNVFFAEETLTLSEKYEPRIFAALNSATLMIAIATREEYYEAVWVRNEWSRYIQKIKTESAEGRQNRRLIAYCRGMKREELPRDMIDIADYLPMDGFVDPQTEMFKRIQDWFAEHGSLDLTGIKGASRMKNAGRSIEVTPESLLRRGHTELDSGQYDSARHTFERTLKMKPSAMTEIDLLTGILLAELKLPDIATMRVKSLELNDIGAYTRLLKTAEAYRNRGADLEQKYNEVVSYRTTCRRNLDNEALSISMYDTCSSYLGKWVNTVEGTRLNGKTVDDLTTTLHMLTEARVQTKENEVKASEIKRVHKLLTLFTAVPAVYSFFVRQSYYAAGNTNYLESGAALVGVLPMLIAYGMLAYPLIKIMNLKEPIIIFLFIMTLLACLYYQFPIVLLILAVVALLGFFLIVDIPYIRKATQRKALQERISQLENSADDLELRLKNEVNDVFEATKAKYIQYRHSVRDWDQMFDDAEKKLSEGMEGYRTRLEA